ncbi:unnamed protein product [Strongylus vulgaris]|uniref:Uncharacterized protein n=1 Tax=Strongylus vulgaris TaxID=40348 RepID=A0A3P7IIJ4_STRVU|nr:unnamed protein product [Strongylus vulgaris]
MSMVHMEPTMIPNCDGPATKSGCYEIVGNLVPVTYRKRIKSNDSQVVTDMMRDFWPSIDKRMPKDEPDCGYRGERCDFTLLIIGGALMITVLITLCGAYALHRIL